MLNDLMKRDPTPEHMVYLPMIPMSSAEAMGMWMNTGVFDRFPELKVVFVEPGVTWVSWWLFMCDDTVKRQGFTAPQLKELPSEYFRRNMWVTVIDEPDPIQSEEIRHRVGVENIMWSSDYPHPVTTWPNSHKIVEELFAGVPARERELMVAGNAKRVWNL
jgi:predicted TIM-barrel fold metal-dependent hydrolase